MCKNVAIVMAAGKGTRVGSDCPKQFLTVNGKMLVEYSLDTFQQHPLIHEMVLVVPADFDEVVLKPLQQKYSKLSAVVPGGAERFQSSWAAVQRFVARPNDILLLHDAARPLMPAHIVDDLLDALKDGLAAVTALPATDTMLQVSDQMLLEKSLKRSTLYCAQTPQVFQAGLLVDCFQKLQQSSDFTPTDESGLVSHFHPEVPVRIVLGDSRNFKVTFAEDLKRL